MEYLRHGRPETSSRRVFFRAVAPVAPIGHAAIASRARHYLLKAGIQVARPGSHTLRHSCVQRLVDADFSLKTIGDFVGHRSPRSTEIYRQGRGRVAARDRARRRRGGARTMTLDDAVSGFLEHKRAIARKYISEEAELRLLVRFCSEQRDRAARTAHPGRAGSVPRFAAALAPRSFNHLLGVVGCLLDWAVAQRAAGVLAAAGAPAAGDRDADPVHPRLGAGTTAAGRGRRAPGSLTRPAPRARPIARSSRSATGWAARR